MVGQTARRSYIFIQISIFWCPRMRWWCELVEKFSDANEDGILVMKWIEMAASRQRA